MEMQDFKRILKEASYTDEKYTIVDYILVNIGALFGGISVIAVIIAAFGKILSYIINRTVLVYWNIDEAFILEGSNTYLKFFLSLSSMFLLVLSYLMARKSILIWYLNSYIFKSYRKQINIFKRDIRKHEKTYNSIRLTYNSESLNTKKAELDEAIKKIHSENKQLINNQNKLEVRNQFFLLLPLVLSLIASFLMYLINGLYIGSIGVKNNVWVGVIFIAITTIIYFFNMLYICRNDSRLNFISSINKTFKNIKLTNEQQHEINRLVEKRIEELSKSSFKQLLTNKTCINLIIFILISLVCNSFIYFIDFRYNLSHKKDFYIYNEDNSTYALLLNNQEDYILSECKISGDTIFIFSDNVFVAKAPVIMKKKKFNKVESKDNHTLANVKSINIFNSALIGKQKFECYFDQNVRMEDGWTVDVEFIDGSEWEIKGNNSYPYNFEKIFKAIDYIK